MNKTDQSEAKLDPLGDWLYEKRIEAILPHIDGRLLDIGCGTNLIVKRHGDGIGVDVFDFGGADLIVPDTSQLPFGNEEFDTVSMAATLNHIPNRTEVLTEVYRVLKPQGVLLITMIPPKLSRVWHFLRKPWDRDQAERGMKQDEVFGFSKKEVRKLLKQQSFEIKREIPFMLGVNTLTVAIKK